MGWAMTGGCVNKREANVMRITVQIIVESDDGQTETVQQIVALDRGSLQPDALGLTIAEAKDILLGVQQTMVTRQAEEYATQSRCCSACGKPRPRKGEHEIVYRTLFGKLKLNSPRYYECRCVGTGRKSESPLAECLGERAAPELVYLETKFASLMSYGLTVELLAEVLPLANQINTTGVRRQVRRVSERLESELGEEQIQFVEEGRGDQDTLPAPSPPLTVGLDGGYVHATGQRSRTEGWFEVIVGKSMPEEGKAKCLAFVNKQGAKPKRRLFEFLKSQGMRPSQQVTFFSDGGETVRNLPRYLNPESEHWLDWFHITMRLTVMGQMTKGIASEAEINCPQEIEENEDVQVDTAAIEKSLERTKWFLWHGNVCRALEVVEDLECGLESSEGSSEKRRKLLKAVKEFGHYIGANKTFIPNYGDRHRHGETISTAFVESAVNYVVSKRMVKKQQMRWSEGGAHQLLQVRTQVLNEDLRRTFCRWYPGLPNLFSDAEMKEAA
jgi:hypothetical protein